MPSNINIHGVLLHTSFFRASLDTKLVNTAEQRKRETDSNLHPAEVRLTCILHMKVMRSETGRD